MSLLSYRVMFASAHQTTLIFAQSCSRVLFFMGYRYWHLALAFRFHQCLSGTPWFWNDTWKFLFGFEVQQGPSPLLQFSTPNYRKTWGYRGCPFNLWQGRRHLTRRDRVETQDSGRMLVSFCFIPIRYYIELMIIDVHLGIVTWDLLTDCLSLNLYCTHLVQLLKSSNSPSLSIPKRDGCNMMQRFRQSSFAKLMEQRGLNSTWSQLVANPWKPLSCFSWKLKLTLKTNPV